ncbi:MAG: hypothetical protein J5982_05340 [Bacilli bacterium]|nr:hypothetical protein [Bacilli bacterium]
MKLSDQLFIIKNKLLKKDNFLLMLVLSFILLIVFICITILNFVIQYMEDIKDYKETRTLIVYNPSIDDIKIIDNMEHIDIFVNKKYDFVSLETDAFGKSSNETDFTIRPLLNKKYAKIVMGKQLENRKDMICPIKFYPYGSTDNNYNKSDLINGKKLIGKSLSLKSSLDNKIYNFNIVGSFKNNVLDEMNYCYVSVEDFDLFASDIEENGCYEDINGVEICDYQKIDDYLLVVDEEKYVENVRKELENKKIATDYSVTISFDEIRTIFAYSFFILTFVLILSVFIIYYYVKKKIISSLEYFGMLKSIGYDDAIITKLERDELVIISIIGFIISMTMYIPLYIYVSHKFLSELFFMNYMIEIPIVLFIIMTLIYLMFIISINRLAMKSRLKLSSSEIFNGK